MLDQKQIRALFEKLNEKLAGKGEVAEIGLIGGAVMCLVFNARKATKDIYAIFRPSALVRELARQIAREEGLSEDWLNDSAKSYIQDGFKRQDVISLSHLRVWAPEARYMLAMKCISARWDTSDKDDVEFLIRFLKIKNPKAVFSIIEKFYPKRLISPKTQFLIEEIFEK